MWRYVESTIEPDLIDETSSKSVVYARKNVEEKERDGETIFAYRENEIPRKEWEAYLETAYNSKSYDEVEEALIRIGKILNN